MDSPVLAKEVTGHDLNTVEPSELSPSISELAGNKPLIQSMSSLGEGTGN
jgi:hypothetical protein